MTANSESRSDRKRKTLLLAATAVFLEKGYDGTSMDDVAARAKVSKPTVYKYFSDKEQLFAEIVHATTDQIDDLVRLVVETMADRSRRQRGPGCASPPLHHCAHAAPSITIAPVGDRQRRPFPRRRPQLVRARLRARIGDTGDHFPEPRRPQASEAWRPAPSRQPLRGTAAMDTGEQGHVHRRSPRRPR